MSAINPTVQELCLMRVSVNVSVIEIYPGCAEQSSSNIWVLRIQFRQSLRADASVFQNFENTLQCFYGDLRGIVDCKTQQGGSNRIRNRVSAYKSPVTLLIYNLRSRNSVLK